MANITYLITGANRGIGLGLTRTLLSRPNTTVIAAVRDPSSTSSSTLSSLPTTSTSTLILVQISAQDYSSPSAAVATLKSSPHHLTKIDIVIANAGISDHYAPAASLSLAKAQEHYEVNFLGPLALFQATLPLLEASEHPQFVGISSVAASLADMDKWPPLPTTAYGSSKVALNFFLRKAHFENPRVVVYAVHPGWVQTDMGNAGAASMGLKEAPTTVEECVNGILGKIDTATREKTGGTFQSFDDTKFNW